MATNTVDVAVESTTEVATLGSEIDRLERFLKRIPGRQDEIATQIAALDVQAVHEADDRDALFSQRVVLMAERDSLPAQAQEARRARDAAVARLSEISPADADAEIERLTALTAESKAATDEAAASYWAVKRDHGDDSEEFATAQAEVNVSADTWIAHEKRLKIAKRYRGHVAGGQDEAQEEALAAA